MFGGKGASDDFEKKDPRSGCRFAIRRRKSRPVNQPRPRPESEKKWTGTALSENRRVLAGLRSCSALVFFSRRGAITVLFRGGVYAG